MCILFMRGEKFMTALPTSGKGLPMRQMIGQPAALSKSLHLFYSLIHIIKYITDQRVELNPINGLSSTQFFIKKM